MSMQASPTLAAALWPVSGTSRALGLARFAALAVAGALAMTLSAKAQVPFYPVPLTLQTLVLLVLGATLGWRIAVASIAIYLLEGALGLPVFAFTPEKGVGLAYMAGPTGGFLASYAFAAGLIGWFAERGANRSVLKLAGVMIVAEIIVFSMGFGWLSTFIGAEKAWAFGVAPFLVPDAIKVALAASLVVGGGALARAAEARGRRVLPKPSPTGIFR